MACELNTNDIGRQEINRLTEHAGFGFDSAHSPTHHADAIDHRGVAVGADECVGVIDIVLFVVMYASRKVFQIDLVNNAKTRRHDTESIERLHPPFEKLIALLIAFKLDFHVEIECLLTAKIIDHHRVIDYQIHGNQRLDRLGFFTHFFSDSTHGRQVR